MHKKRPPMRPPVRPDPCDPTPGPGFPTIPPPAKATDINVNIHGLADPRLDQILKLLQQLTIQGDTIMAQLKTFTDLLTAIDAETNRIAAKLEELAATVGGGGLSSAEEDQVEASLTALSNRLKTIGANPADPIPVDPNPLP